MRKKKSTLQPNGKSPEYPRDGEFELTPLCNLDCRMCYVHLNDSSVKNRMLTGDRWIDIMREAFDRGMLTALLTGGEAMTHPDFRKIYMFLIEHGVMVSLKTNGILLNKTNLEFLREFPPERIDVSLYGCNSESYIAVTGHDAFATVRDNIRRTVDSGLSLHLAVTLNKYMLPWAGDVVRLANSFHAESVGIGGVVEAREETGRSIREFGLPAGVSAAAKFSAEELVSPEYRKAAKKRSGLENVPLDSEFGLRCGAGKNRFGILWNGTMEPCLSFPSGICSAHPFREGFDSAWKRINEGVHSYAVPKECLTCDINSKCHFRPCEHGQFSVEHRCDESMCDFWHHYHNLKKTEL